MASKMRLGLMLLALAACREHESSSRPKITQGREVDAAQFPAVSLQKLDSTGAMFSYCTGVLISPRHVLTAAHCSIDERSVSAMPADVAARKVVAYDSRPERPQAQRLDVASIALAPGFSLDGMGRNQDGLIIPAAAHDLSVWTLATAAPDGVLGKILRPEQVEQAFHDKAPVVLLGFGKRSGWDSPWLEHTLAMAETMHFTSVEMTAMKTVLQDGRPRKKYVTHVVAGRSSTEFFAGGKDLPDTCKGDSGGPAFVKDQDGSLLLAGITSRGSIECNQGGVYTLVPAYVAWIAQQTSLAL